MKKLEEVDVLQVLEIIEARLKRASTIFCSRFSPEGWLSMLGKVQMAEAILDRIIHDSYKILVDGEIRIKVEYCLLEICDYLDEEALNHDELILLAIRIIND